MTALSPVKISEQNAETFVFAGRHAATAEPTAGDLLKAITVHPQHGYEWTAQNDERGIVINSSGRIGIECTAHEEMYAIAWMEFGEV